MGGGLSLVCLSDNPSTTPKIAKSGAPFFAIVSNIFAGRNGPHVGAVMPLFFPL